ncbi:acetamidase/formamidase family protein [Algiphilus sp.]|uniref:acetamidase/formamidase family protein n=1 Tax=Algiphilus sp. TaxID=1872431 RepID=UPI0032EDA461
MSQTLISNELNRIERMQSLQLLRVVSTVTFLALSASPVQATECEEGNPRHHTVAASASTVHWGYFSKNQEPVLEVRSGDFVTLEALTHHAGDDFDRMIKGDPGAESVYQWNPDGKNVERRGAGPMDASIHGRGAGEGFGVHIMTGPVRVCGAEPGDVLEVRILDVHLRPSGNPAFEGRTYGSNVAANWGFHYNDLIAPKEKREVVTIFELDSSGGSVWAKPLYSYRWTPQTDPFGVTHETIDYPGVVVNPETVTKRPVLEGVQVRARPHFGTMGVAPREADLVDTVPPAYFGGNIDNWRIGKGATMYYPVAVEGALFSVGDPHAAQGDSELSGTAIETSLTGTFQLVLHKQSELKTTRLADLHYPLLETEDAWIVHGFSYPNYLAELEEPQQSIYQNSSIDRAMRDAFRKMRHFLMTAEGLTEDEAISLMSVGADFGITQVVDGNWGVHGTIKKEVFMPR